MASTGLGAKRGPSVLVTDSREQQRRARPRQPAREPRSTTRLISVDNVLQYASEIPSQQQRGPPGRRPVAAGPRPAIRGDPRLLARLTPQHMPSRSTKLSEKLVLLPELAEEDETGAEADFGVDNEAAPLRDDEEARRTFPSSRAKSYAERLPKASRAEKLPRVTAYCTAQAFKTKLTASFVKDKHGAKTKLYDDCLYTAYHLPLLPGSDGYRIRSSPVIKSPGGKAVLDEEIERSEQRTYREGYFEDAAQYGVKGGEEAGGRESPLQHRDHDDQDADHHHDYHDGVDGDRQGRPEESDSGGAGGRRDSTRSDSPARIAPDALSFAEMFVFTYGVVVFWNFSEKQEKDILADLTFSESETGLSLAYRPQREEDFETEEFHFEYRPEIPRPRVFNDMITLRSGDHMIKLAMSHAIAQSTKLSFFEERMANTMLEAQYVPRRLALTGHLGMTREEVMRILGRLFKSRVDVNLSSNMLDVPNFFWDSEPTLHPLYFAVREYLEIKPRIQVLNERCRVFLDLAAILTDAIADKKMSRLTWIIIVLIVISIGVTCSEVLIRFGMLSTRSKSALLFSSGSGSDLI
ncbi:DUF155-domain-containing protein [Xylona heveae TC161]|uniref:DUF155-domain-containing protein n=1 Tax=Xylona heveae (strain CBS 132557 / TC161) TaxID=1328760 RepID=A0A165I3W4_XYLHT|nr:DUF155-domain-containing protein [Xylona heveae TC161]KZF24343.1 DUF155-domain-containing protein [Xylona heveae TC161]